MYHLRDITSAEAGYSGDITLNVGDTTITRSGTVGTDNSLIIYFNDYINDFKSKFNNNKLLCYPYTAFELYTHDGSSTTLIPQNVVMRLMGGTFCLTGRVVLTGGYTPSETVLLATGWDEGTGVEMFASATQSFSGFPTIAVSQDAYAQFIARNSNSLKF